MLVDASMPGMRVDPGTKSDGGAELKLFDAKATLSIQMICIELRIAKE